MNAGRFGRAYQLYQEQRYEEAADVFRQIGGADGACGEAECLFQLGRTDEAQEAVDRCLALEPDHAGALGLVASLHPEDRSAVGLSDPPAEADSCLSAQRQRPFVGRDAYPTIGALETALQAAKAAMPSTGSAYKPSGRTTVLAIMGFLFVTPFLMVLLAVLCAGICIGYWYLKDFLHTGAPGDPAYFGWASLVLDAGLGALIVFLPPIAYGRLSRLLKNREPCLPAVLSVFVALPAAALLFLPLIKGMTLAPTGITFFDISIRWLLIGGGLLIPPIGAAVLAYSRITDNRFCEVTGVSLSPVRRFHLAFDFSENALELLRRGRYSEINQLPRCSPSLQRWHSGEVFLWWNERAETAFLEMRIFFRSIMLGKQDSAKADNWLAFSVQLDRATAQTLYAMYTE